MLLENLLSIAKMLTPSNAPPPGMKYWMLLSQEDRDGYAVLTKQFSNQNRSTMHDRSVSLIKQEITTILNYVNKQNPGHEFRALLCGICSQGNFLYVNTKQLRNTLGRCKSSINYGFQQLGYSSVKAKIRKLLEAVLPSLAHDPAAARRWTVRTCETPQPPKTLAPLPTPIFRVPSLPQDLNTLYPLPIIPVRQIPPQCEMPYVMDNENDYRDIISGDSFMEPRSDDIILPFTFESTPW